MNIDNIKNYISITEKLKNEKESILDDIRKRIQIQYPTIRTNYIRKFEFNEEKEELQVWIGDGGFCGNWYSYDYDYLTCDIDTFKSLKPNPHHHMYEYCSCDEVEEFDDEVEEFGDDYLF